MMYFCYIVDIRYVVYFIPKSEQACELKTLIMFVPSQNLFPEVCVIFKEKYQPNFKTPPTIIFLKPTFNEIGSQPPSFFNVFRAFSCVTYYCP